MRHAQTCRSLSCIVCTLVKEGRDLLRAQALEAKAVGISSLPDGVLAQILSTVPLSKEKVAMQV